MRFSNVNEIDDGSLPSINSDSVKVYDPIKQIFYVYGGTRWPDNENTRSPTNKPTADFHAFRPYPSPRWDNYTTHTRQDEAFISPFEETLAHPDGLNLALPKLGSLPALKNACGAIAYDNTASRTRFLLILGEPVTKEGKSYNHPITICVNLELNTWRTLRLKNAKWVPRGRSRASMIVVGEMRARDSEVFLCLFGGVEEDPDAGSIRYLDTFAIANLSKGTWTVPNGNVPGDIGPLGIHPGLAKYRSQKTDREVIILFKGAIEEPPFQENNITHAKVDFSKAYIFDPREKNNPFFELEVETSSRHPRPAKSFLFQESQARAEYCDEFIVVSCGRQRSLNAFPGLPAQPDELENLYTRPRIEVWIATIEESIGEAEYETLEVQEADSDSEDSTSEDESSDSSTDTASARRKKTQGSSGIFAQRAIRSGQAVIRKSESKLSWRNMTEGKVKESLRSLNDSFRIEAMFLSGILSTQFDLSEISENHSLSPKLILLGSDHEFLGEIRVDLFNAVAEVSLRSLVEANHDETEDESVSARIDETMTARSTPDFGELAEETVIYDDDRLYDSYSIEDTEENNSSDGLCEMSHEMSPQARHDETWLELVSEEQLDPSLIGRMNGTDPFLLSPINDTMDIEIENIFSHATADDTPPRHDVLLMLGSEEFEENHIETDEYTSRAETYVHMEE